MIFSLSSVLLKGLGNLRVASCELRVASCELRVASCELRIASCELRIASCELRVADSVPQQYYLTVFSKL